MSSLCERVVDLVVGCRAERGPRDDELPSQVEVDLEPRELDRPVEEAPEHVGVRRLEAMRVNAFTNCSCASEPVVSELGERPHRVAGLGGELLAVLVGEVAAEGELEAGEREAARRRLGLVADAAEHEPHERARGQLGVAHRVPRRAEHDGSRDRVGELAEPGDGGGERAVRRAAPSRR